VKFSRIVIVIVVIAIVALVALYAIGSILTPSSKSSSAWIPEAEYPVQVSGTIALAGQQCVSGTSYIYCIGGQDANGGPRSEVYAAPGSGNITGWTSETQYPQAINGQSCVAYSGYLYCIGGTYDDGGDDIASSYFAPLGSGGTVGTWAATTQFPIPIDSQSCVPSSGFVFCVGGNNETDGTNADSTASNSVWYATLSGSGIGSWSQTTAYPGNVYFPSCITADSYIYCLGGVDSNFNPVSTSYSAPLTSAGVGAWTLTTVYPIQESGQACAASSGTVYCVGGEEGQGTYTGAAYYATVSSGSIGPWKQTSSYPLSSQTDCVISSGNIYCVGGFDGSSVGENGAVYYSSLTKLLDSS
jgi:hypothetical protein